MCIKNILFWFNTLKILYRESHVTFLGTQAIRELHILFKSSTQILLRYCGMILSNCNLKLQTWFNSHLLPGPSWAHLLATCNMQVGEATTPSILSWLPAVGTDYSEVREWREVMKGRFLFGTGMFIRWYFALGTWQMLHVASLSPGHFLWIH